MEDRIEAFISYHREDNNFQLISAVKDRLIDNLKTILGVSSVNVFLDKDVMPSSGILKDKIKCALSVSEYLVVFLSQGYLDSEWCMVELDEFRKKYGRLDSSVQDRIIIVEIAPTLLESYKSKTDLNEDPITIALYDPRSGLPIPTNVTKSGTSEAVPNPKIDEVVADMCTTMKNELLGSVSWKTQTDSVGTDLSMIQEGGSRLILIECQEKELVGAMEKKLHEIWDTLDKNASRPNLNVWYLTWEKSDRKLWDLVAKDANGIVVVYSESTEIESFVTQVKMLQTKVHKSASKSVAVVEPREGEALWPSFQCRFSEDGHGLDIVGSDMGQVHNFLREVENSISAL